MFRDKLTESPGSSGGDAMPAKRTNVGGRSAVRRALQHFAPLNRLFAAPQVFGSLQPSIAGTNSVISVVFV